MTTLITVVLFILAAITLHEVFRKHFLSKVAQKEKTISSLLENLCTLSTNRDMWKDKYVASERALTQLKDDITAVVIILAEQAPIFIDTYKRLEHECDCGFCRDLFKDYLDMSEGLTVGININGKPTIVECPTMSYPDGGIVEVPDHKIIVGSVAQPVTVEATEPELQSAPVVMAPVYTPGTYPSGMVPAKDTEEPTKE